MASHAPSRSDLVLQFHHDALGVLRLTPEILESDLMSLGDWRAEPRDVHAAENAKGDFGPMPHHGID